MPTYAVTTKLKYRRITSKMIKPTCKYLSLNVCPFTILESRGRSNWLCMPLFRSSSGAFLSGGLQPSCNLQDCDTIMVALTFTLLPILLSSVQGTLSNLSTTSCQNNLSCHSSMTGDAQASPTSSHSSRTRSWFWK